MAFVLPWYSYQIGSGFVQRSCRLVCNPRDFCARVAGEQGGVRLRVAVSRSPVGQRAHTESPDARALESREHNKERFQWQSTPGTVFSSRLNSRRAGYPFKRNGFRGKDAATGTVF